MERVSFSYGGSMDCRISQNDDMVRGLDLYRLICMHVVCLPYLASTIQDRGVKKMSILQKDFCYALEHKIPMHFFFIARSELLANKYVSCIFAIRQPVQ